MDKRYFTKKYNEESDEGYFLDVDVQCLEKLHEFHNGLPFLPERMKIEKVEKVVANLHDKTMIPFCTKKMNIEKVEKLQLIYMIKLNMLSRKKFKANIKS